MADLTDQEKKDFLADVAAIRSAVLSPLKDGKGSNAPSVILERTLDVSRRTLAAVLADAAVPVDVELDAEAVDALADALLARLPKETAEAVLSAMHDRLAK